MDAQERIRILELAYEVVRHELPTAANTSKESIDAWHKLFDQAYKAVFKTALG